MWAVILLITFPLGMFVIMRTGLFKSWLLITPTGRTSPTMWFGALPISFGFFVMLAATWLPNYHYGDYPLWPSIVLLCCVVLSFRFMHTPPQILKPYWLRWLEREYGYIMPLLIMDGREHDRWEWESKVSTREGMQTWIDSVIEKYPDQVGALWLLYKFEQHSLYFPDPYRGFRVGDTYPVGSLPNHKQHDCTISSHDEIALYARVSRHFWTTGEYSIKNAHPLG